MPNDEMSKVFGGIAFFWRRWWILFGVAGAIGTLYLLVALAPRPHPAPEILWTFEAVDRGVILSTPLVSGDRVYVSAAHASGLNTFGTVYCLDRTTGKA